MVITSVSERRPPRHSNSQSRYALTYIIITLVVLLFLNIYTSGTTQKLIYQEKESAMIEKCLLASDEVANLEVLNRSTVASAVSQMGIFRITRMIITDHNGLVLYDSMRAELPETCYALFPEIVYAMSGYDTFSWEYNSGIVQSRAATPVLSYGTLVGCVYMVEYDAVQGELIHSLQKNIFTITLVLELVLIVFSIFFSSIFSKRMRRILTSLRNIREGNYSYKVEVGGQDELTALGNEFNDLTEKLQTSENKRRQFVSDASHELKTPLASIKLLSDSILQNEMDIDTVREFVGDIGHEADRLNRMSQKLLSLSRIESQQDGDCEIIYMRPSVERVIRMLNGIALENQIVLELDVQQDCPILILEDDLYQIAFNLTENGIKYNVPGGKLTIRLLRNDDNGILQVSDTGVGIPPDAIGHVFERFYRVDKARSRKSGGSGLGLAIVRNMVERNEGTITVESTPGQGSTFTVTFPAFDTGEEEEQ